MNKLSTKNELIFEKNNLPKGWIRTKLDNLCELIGGGTPSRQKMEYFNGDILWLTPTEIPKNKITQIYESREKITRLGLKKSSAKIVPTDSVLLTSRASIGYVAITGTEITTNQGFASFVCKKIIHNYFLAYWLFGNKNLLESQATGTTFKEISKSKLRELEIPLPPLPEQKRIVQKIESIFSQIDAGKEKLEDVRKLLKQNKQSVLKSAFDGNFTEKWRKDNKIQFTSWKDVKIQDVVSKPKQDIVDGPFGSNLKSESYVYEGIPLIRIQNVERNTFVNKNIKYITKEKSIQLKRHSYQRNDIVITKLGFPVGKACIVPSSVNKGIIIADIIRLRSNNKFAINKYLTFLINSSKIINQFNKHTKGTRRPRVNLTKFRDFIIPLPSIFEQKIIILKIESIFGRIDAIEKQVDDSLTKLDQLKKSVLKKAFEGKLVPQDPNDEPASILLEKIKQEKSRI